MAQDAPKPSPRYNFTWAAQKRSNYEIRWKRPSGGRFGENGPSGQL